MCFAIPPSTAPTAGGVARGPVRTLGVPALAAVALVAPLGLALTLAGQNADVFAAAPAECSLEYLLHALHVATGPCCCCLLSEGPQRTASLSRDAVNRLLDALLLEDGFG